MASLRCCCSRTVKWPRPRLAEALNVLVVQVFRKDDYAAKYAVEPLLSG
ncbi:MltR family transcriptional regulator, partial [Serratia sp. CY81166]